MHRGLKCSFNYFEFKKIYMNGWNDVKSWDFINDVERIEQKQKKILTKIISRINMMQETKIK